MGFCPDIGSHPGEGSDNRRDPGRWPSPFPPSCRRWRWTRLPSAYRRTASFSVQPQRAGWRFPPDCWRCPPRRGGGIRVKQRLRLCLTHNFTPERRQVRPLPFQCKQLIAIFISHAEKHRNAVKAKLSLAVYDHIEKFDGCAIINFYCADIILCKSILQDVVSKRTYYNELLAVEDQDVVNEKWKSRTLSRFYLFARPCLKNAAKRSK